MPYNNESLIVVKDDETVVNKGELEALQSDQAFLNALMAAGVDNWEGYSDAQESCED